MTRHIELNVPSGPLSLAGTLTVPNTAPCPAALLISGSGPIDRNSNAKRLPINVMGAAAAHLADAGIASLRYDKRGVGDSDGDYLSTGLHDNIVDARSALETLRARPEIDPTQIFVIGHSEGAIIASALAGDDRLAGVALLAGTAHNGHEVLTWQARQLAPTLPKPARWLMRLLRQDLVRTQKKRLARIAASTDDVIRIQMVKLNAKWFREFMSYEPIDALSTAKVPVLAITGAKDIQVDPTDIHLIEQAVSTPFTGHVIDDVSHLLRTETGPPSVRTYKKQARQPLDPRVVSTLTAWLSMSAANLHSAQS